MALQPDISPQEAQQKLSDFANKAGREVRVFIRDAAVRRGEEEDEEKGKETEGGDGVAPAEGAEAAGAAAGSGDDFYEFTAADYARLMASKKEERFLRLKKHREQDLQERRSRIHKAVIRVLLPDGFVLESTFSPADTIADVRALVKKCLANPDTPFYFFTTPPKRRIKDETLDLYSAQLTPGALIHFGIEESSPATAGPPSLEPLLLSEVMDLKDLHSIVSRSLETQNADAGTEMDEDKSEQKMSEIKPKTSDPGKKTKPGVPKWFKR